MPAKKKAAPPAPRVGRPKPDSKIAELRGDETRAQLSKRSGVAYRSLTKYETGKAKPYGENRAKLAKALKVAPEELA